MERRLVCSLEATFGYYSAKSQRGRAAVLMADRRPWCYVGNMASFLSTFIVPIAIAAVVLVLLLGLINMMRGGSPNRSQKLMRLRVLLQFVAIVIIMLTVWAMGH